MAKLTGAALEKVKLERFITICEIASDMDTEEETREFIETLSPEVKAELIEEVWRMDCLVDDTKKKELFSAFGEKFRAMETQWESKK